VGLLLTIPNTISSLIEPILGILGDLGQRRQLILGGGVAFAIAKPEERLRQQGALAKRHKVQQQSADRRNYAGKYSRAIAKLYSVPHHQQTRIPQIADQAIEYF
jgi:hypothetical protein